MNNESCNCVYVAEVVCRDKPTELTLRSILTSLSSLFWFFQTTMSRFHCLGSLHWQYKEWHHPQVSGVLFGKMKICKILEKTFFQQIKTERILDTDLCDFASAGDLNKLKQVCHINCLHCSNMTKTSVIAGLKKSLFKVYFHQHSRWNMNKNLSHKSFRINPSTFFSIPTSVRYHFMHDLWCYGLVSKYSNFVSLSTGLQVIYCLDFRRKMTLGVLSYLGSTQMCVFLEENRRPNSFPLTCLFHEARILKVHLCLCSWLRKLKQIYCRWANTLAVKMLHPDCLCSTGR